MRYLKSARYSFALILLCALTTAAGAGETPAQSKAAFEKLKSLAGDWQGSIGEKAGGPAILVSYKTTSGGSVVTETLFAGTDHEMVTVYYLDGGKLVLVHYCAVGNQPRMALAPSSTADHFVFEFAGGTNLNPQKDMHMHSARLTFEGGDQVVGEWDSYKDGKFTGTHKFYLSRKARQS